MTFAADIPDYVAFGNIVRKRRRELGLSQEALASAALGNPDRKTFVSAIENSRLEKVTPNTAQKLSGPLGLTIDDVPASLRWPSASDPSPIETRLTVLESQYAAAQSELEERAISRFLNRKLVTILSRSITDAYYDRLVVGVDALRVWTGAPFSLRSFLVCYALSLTYLVVSGLIGFFSGDISVGEIRPFQTWDAMGQALQAASPLFAFVLLVATMIWCWYIIRPFGQTPLTERHTAMRLTVVALIAGVACGVVDYLGAKTMAAAALFAVPCVAALSTLTPRRAAIYGAAGGILFGLMAAISSGLTDNGVLAFLTSLSEGFIIGGIVGACAGVVSSLIAQRMPNLRPGQLAAAGGGLGVGAVASLVGMLIAGNFSAISDGMVGLFALSWLALPIANAVLDHLSLGISHTIARYVATNRLGLFAVCLHFLLDLLLAIGFMVLTVVAVGYGLHAVTFTLGIQTLSHDFLVKSAADPWGDGLWLTLMALTTTLWTMLHLALIVAPIIAANLTRQFIERPAGRRVPAIAQDSPLDVSMGVLVALRSLTFFGVWGLVAVFPMAVLWRYPQVMDGVLHLGQLLSAGLITH